MVFLLKAKGKQDCSASDKRGEASFQTMSKVIKIEKGSKKAFPKKTTCYILITCSEPDQEGKMEVEMNYDGDEVLAAYLLESATKAFDDTAVKKGFL